MKYRIYILLVSILATLHASATVLIFEPSINFGNLSQNYGDRVAAISQDGLLYGSAGGFTPNVLVSYSGTPRLWTTDYGDLANVMYSGGGLTMDITLTADPGYSVQLSSFDMAGWFRTDRTIPGVQVFDGNNTPLFSHSNVLIQGDANGPQHTSFTFAGTLTAPLLRIRFDPSAAGFESVGIDNIRFAQVPEPSVATLGILGVVLAWAWGRLRRLRR